MLSMFVVKRTFYKLEVKLWVDCEKRDASITTKYAGILQDVHQHVIFADVDSPEKAEAYLGRPIRGVDGDVPLIEWLEAHHRRKSAA
jgi:hypothetical protein